ncbi:translation initiation factor IF-3 [candidate division KSB1 bacterium]|nr:translation initiation factor IF-3 [candidate division KSB1 bacterium]
MNNQIKNPTVRLINAEGEQVGVVDTVKALELAEHSGLDLVEVSPKANPPVCKIMDYGKYKYELSKKEKIVKKRQQVILVKEIRLRPKIEIHDFDFKVKHARKFIEEGNKVKLTVMFKGREMAHLEFGKELLERFQMELSDVAKVEKSAQLEGRNMILIFTKK